MPPPAPHRWVPLPVRHTAELLLLVAGAAVHRQQLAAALHQRLGEGHRVVGVGEAADLARHGDRQQPRSAPTPGLALGFGFRSALRGKKKKLRLLPSFKGSLDGYPESHE